ncbi:MAG: hypothetical protein IJP94_03750, partial [Clostridia bacterium]|nr:hypothetical protein [Clostridia bacterium]
MESKTLIANHVIVTEPDENGNEEIVNEYMKYAQIPSPLYITTKQNVKVDYSSVKILHNVGFNVYKNNKEIDPTDPVKFTPTPTGVVTGTDTNIGTEKWYVAEPVNFKDKKKDVDLVITDGSPATDNVKKGSLLLNVAPPNMFADPMVVSGDDFTVALKSDGTVWAWGANTYGQLGYGFRDGRNEDTQGPVQVLAVADPITKDDEGNLVVPAYTNNKVLKGIHKIDAGEHHVLAKASDGTVYAWGWNKDGQLGIDSTVDQNRPVKVFSGTFDGADEYLAFVQDIAAGGRHSLAIVRTSEYYFDGNKKTGSGDDEEEEETTTSAMKQRTINSIYSWGANDYGQLGYTVDKNLIGEGQYVATPVRVVDGQAAEGTTAGGDSGDDDTQTDAYDKDVYILNAVKLAAGKNHSAAIVDSFDESDKNYNYYKYVFTWGSNEYGQMGASQEDYEYQFPYPLSYGENTSYAYPPAVSGENGYSPADENLCGIIDIASGDNHLLFLREESLGSDTGVVMALGNNSKGQLGRGLSSAYEYNVTSRGSNQYFVTLDGSAELGSISAIAANGDSSMLLDKYGRVYVLGDNSKGQLGNGTKDNDSHNKAIYNQQSALTSYTTDIKRENKSIGLGAKSGYVMREDGYLYAFGYNGDGQLGEMSREDRIIPVRVGSVEDEILSIDVTLPGAASPVKNPNVVNITKGQTVQIGTKGTLIEMR